MSKPKITLFNTGTWREQIMLIYSGIFSENDVIQIKTIAHYGKGSLKTYYVCQLKITPIDQERPVGDLLPAVDDKGLFKYIIIRSMNRFNQKIYPRYISGSSQLEIPEDKNSYFMVIKRASISQLLSHSLAQLR